MTTASTNMDLQRRMHRLEDERALAQLVQSYLALADTRRWQEWVETFTEDARFDLPNSFGLMQGRAEIYEVCVEKMEGTWDDTQHLIVNTDFEVDGDTASGTANIIFAGLPSGGAVTDVYLMGGRYRWQFARTPQGWRIADAWEEFIWNNGSALKAVFEQDAG